MIAKVVKMQKGMEEMTNEELLVLYQESRDQGIKQELTLRYLYLAKSVAIQMNNLYSDFMQMEDIIHEGVIAIMKGIDDIIRNGTVNLRHLFRGAYGEP